MWGVGMTCVGEEMSHMKSLACARKEPPTADDVTQRLLLPSIGVSSLGHKIIRFSTAL
jgi:hypothetical protein